MLEHHDVKVVCPWCASFHDCATEVSIEPGAPENGSYNVCIKCSRISVYDTEVPGGLRLPSPEELESALQDTEVCKALWAIRRSHYHIKRKAN